MSAVKFTFDTHFGASSAGRADAEKRSRKSYSAEEIAVLTSAAHEQGLTAGSVRAEQATAAALAQLSAAVGQAIAAMDSEVEAMRAYAVQIAFACAKKLAGAALA